MNEKNNDTEDFCEWKARRVRVKIVVYVIIVFVTLIMFSYFGLRSTTTIKALSITAIGTALPLLVGVFTQMRYRMTKKSLELQTMFNNKESSFKTVFNMDSNVDIKITRNGFKYYKPFCEVNFFKSFWSKYISDEYSGEVHVERADAERVLAALKKYGVNLK